jgi:branched-chain amino acid transport system permease protein
VLIYVYEVTSLACLFIIASVSLNLVVAQGGLFSLMHGALIGVGAYIFALTVVGAGLHPAIAIVFAVLGTASFGALLAAPSVGLDEEQFAVVTLAMHLLIVVILLNWVSLTKGAYGIAEIPKLQFSGSDEQQSFMILTLVLAAAVCWIFRMLERSGFGTLLHASAVDSAMVRSLGGPVWRFRVAAFAIGSSGAGLSGALYAMQAGYIAPSLFDLHLSVLILAMVIVGGAKRMSGAALGAIVLIVLPELLRFAAFNAVSAGPVRQIVFGCILIFAVFVHLRRRGTLAR